MHVHDIAFQISGTYIHTSIYIDIIMLSDYCRSKTLIPLCLAYTEMGFIITSELTLIETFYVIAIRFYEYEFRIQAYKGLRCKFSFKKYVRFALSRIPIASTLYNTDYCKKMIIFLLDFLYTWFTLYLSSESKLSNQKKASRFKRISGDPGLVQLVQPILDQGNIIKKVRLCAKVTYKLSLDIYKLKIAVLGCNFVCTKAKVISTK